MPKLVLLLSDGSTRDVPLRKDRITLGRRPDNDVCLPHPAVSGEHAAVVTILTDSFLEDLDSTNGTFVNGQPVQKHFLRDGDVIELGRQRLVFLVDEDAHPPGYPPAPAQAAASGRTIAVADPMHWDKPSTIPGVTPVAQDAPAAMRAAASPQPAVPTLTEAVDHAAPPVAQQLAPHGTPHPAAPVSTQGGRPVVANPVAAAAASAANADSALAPTALPELMVLTGPSAGRTLALTKDVTSIGRVGVQIALVRRTPRGFMLFQGDGSPPPVLNGSPVDGEGVVLEPGDIIDVAGARIEFLAATDLPL